jgi:hypothetical protein
VHDAHILALDDQRMDVVGLAPEVDDHLLRLGEVQLQEVAVAPVHQLADCLSVLGLIRVAAGSQVTSHYFLHRLCLTIMGSKSLATCTIPKCCLQDLGTMLIIVVLL